MLTPLLRLVPVLLVLGAAVRQESPRIVAVGDVHGNLDAFVAILQKAGLVDGTPRWTGGRATLVQLGDMLDRGPKSRATMDFLIELQKDASDRGGSVRVSLGNHEVMSIVGDLRYVQAGDYASFADDRSERRRREAYRDYERFMAGRGEMADESAWMEAHPPGFVEHREAFGPRGKYGKWLRDAPAVNRIDDTVFLHGGINPALKARSIEQINEVVRAELELFDRITRYMVDTGLALPFFTLEEFANAAKAEVDRRKNAAPVAQTPEEQVHIQILEGLLQAGNWLSIHSDGPLWFRGYDQWSEEEGAALLAPAAETLGVRRFVTGHSIQSDGLIRSRFGGMVILADTGLVAGRASAIELSDSGIRAIYPDRETDLN